MFNEYHQLRNLGHGRRESFNRAMSYLLETISPLNHYDNEPLEVKLEKKLVYLESHTDEINFQSLTKILNTKPENFPGRYRTKAELGLTRLHEIYCHYRFILSERQIERYEQLLPKIPEEFDELLDAVESCDLAGYEKRKKEAIEKLKVEILK